MEAAAEAEVDTASPSGTTSSDAAHT